ncbi:Fosmidomycin resistance protein [Paenibacillus sp. P1XP2]|nr:Fosmidomycin resistance protein [Paenibacillus sp. P1XP2]
MSVPTVNTAAPQKGRQPLAGTDAGATVFRILIAISLVHLFNDSIQSVIPAIFPILRSSMHLNYTQIGWISFAINFTSSIMQPVVGWFADRKPKPALLPIGMGFTFTGMLLLAFAESYPAVLIAVVFVGLGSAAFHPEGSRVAHMASGSRRGLAQSIFQVGGNAGQSLAPMLTMWIFIPLGLFGSIWFTLVAGAGIAVQMYIARWYGRKLQSGAQVKKKAQARRLKPEVRTKVRFAIVMLVVLVFVRSWYSSSISTFFPFYLIDHFGLSVDDAQIFIFLFLGAGAWAPSSAVRSRTGSASETSFLLPWCLPRRWRCSCRMSGYGASASSLRCLADRLLQLFGHRRICQMLFPGKIGTVSG